MADLAELEIQVDSADTLTASKALKGFSSAAEDAAKSADDLAQSTGKVRDEKGRFIKGAKAAAGAATKAGEAADKSSKKFDALGKATDFAKKQFVALSAALGVIAVVRDAVKVVGDFEQAMTTLSGVMRKSRAEMAALEKQAKEMGATTRFSATQAAEAQLALARAGQTQAQVMASLPSVLALASGAQLQLGESAGFVAQSLAQFGLAADEAGRVADVFVGVANRANTDVRQLAEGMKVVGPVASKMGNDLEGTAAALGVLANAGLQGSVGATALRSALSRLAAPSKEAQGIIDKLAKSSGQSVDAFDSSKRSIEQLFKAFAKAGASTGELVKVFGQEGLAGALTLIGDTEGLTKLGDQATKVAGEAQELADVMSNTLQGSMASLRSAVEALFISVGDSGLAGGLKTVIDALTITVRSMSGVETKMGEFSVTSVALSKVLKLIVFLAKAAGVSFLAMAGHAATAKIATLGLAGAIRAVRTAIVSTGIGILVVGLGELVAALSDGNDAITKMVDDMNELENAAKGATDATDKLTAAQKKQREETEKASTPFEILKARYLSLEKANEDLFKSIRTTLREQDKVRAVTDEMRDAYALAVKEGLELGLTMDQARARAQKVAQAFGALVQVNQNLTKRLDEVKNGVKQVSETTKTETSAMQKALDSLFSKVADSSFIDSSTRELDKLLAKFRELAEGEGFDEAGVVDFLKQIREQFEIIERNRGFSKAIDDGRKAFEDLAAAARDLEQSNTLLSLQGATTREKVMAEYAGAIQQVQREVAVLLTQGKITNEQGMERLRQLDDTINKIIKQRDEQAGLTKANEEAEAAALALAEAQQAWNDAVAAIDTAGIREFPATVAEARDAIKELEAAGRQAGVSMEQVAQQIAKVWEQTVLGAVNKTMNSIIDRTGDLAITLLFDAETAEETEAAVQAFMDDIQKTLVREILIQPVLDSIKGGLGDALGDAFGGSQATGEGALLSQAGTQLTGAAGQLSAAANALQGAGIRTSVAAGSTQTAALTTNIASTQTGLAATQTGAAAAQTGAAAGQTSAAAGQLQSAAGALQAGAASGGGGGGSGGGGNVLGAIGGLVGGAVLIGQLGKSIGDAKRSQDNDGSTSAAANGAVYANRELRFANGGVLQRPMTFPIKGGTGLAGEAGPEAILPARRSGGGFAVQADVGGRNMLAQVQRMRSGKMGVRMFANGGVITSGEEVTNTTSLAQPTQSERRFPTQPRIPVTTRATVVNMTVNARDAGSFKRSDKQIKKGLRRI